MTTIKGPTSPRIPQSIQSDIKPKTLEHKGQLAQTQDKRPVASQQGAQHQDVMGGVGKRNVSPPPQLGLPKGGLLQGLRGGQGGVRPAFGQHPRGVQPKLPPGTHLVPGGAHGGRIVPNHPTLNPKIGQAFQNALHGLGGKLPGGLSGFRPRIPIPVSPGGLRPGGLRPGGILGGPRIGGPIGNPIGGPRLPRPGGVFGGPRVGGPLGPVIPRLGGPRLGGPLGPAMPRPGGPRLGGPLGPFGGGHGPVVLPRPGGPLGPMMPRPTGPFGGGHGPVVLPRPGGPLGPMMPRPTGPLLPRPIGPLLPRPLGPGLRPFTLGIPAQPAIGTNLIESIKAKGTSGL